MINEQERVEFEVLAPEEHGGDIGVMLRAEIDIQIATAKRYPRQLSKVKAAMLSFACLDEETAASCFYTVPRSGKNVQGPSIRMAEIAMSAYGNIRSGNRILSTVTDGENPHVVVQGVCHDLENNVAISIEKRRRIFRKKDKDGNLKPVDEDSVNLAANAGGAIALRDAVFKVVPLALIKPVVEQAKKVAIGTQVTLADRRAKMLDYFAKMGIVKERVFASVGKTGADDVGLSELETLIGFSTSLKEGHANIDGIFPPVPSATTSNARVVTGFDNTSTAATDKKDELTTTESPKTPPVTTETKAKAPKTPKLEKTALDELKKIMDAHSVTSAAVINVAKHVGIIKDETLTSLNDVFEIEPSAIGTLVKSFMFMLSQFRAEQ